MWVFLNDAFVSVVKDTQKKDGLMIRARLATDLQNAFGIDVEIIETTHTDYRFRTFMDKNAFKEFMSNRIDEIEYTNFKNSIDNNDTIRKDAYMGVWAEMDDLQERYYPRKRDDSWIKELYKMK